MHIIYQTIISLLQKHGITYKEYNHGPILNYEDADREQKAHGWQGTESKNVFIQSKSGRYYIFVTTYGEKVDFGQLKELLGEKCSIGTREDVEPITKCVPGCISPFGFPEEVTIIIDPRIFTHTDYLFSPGITTKTIQLNGQDLKPVFADLPNTVLYL